MNDTKAKIKNIADTIENEVLGIRRHLHANPELSFQEVETSKYICDKLDEFGIEYRSGIAKYGILGIIKGEKPGGKIIALRADMDALPVVEENSLEFKSKNSGVMHACGHDIHSASLLGTAKILNELKSEFAGTVLLIFQLGEERIPGGAHLMMEDGLFKDYTPELIIGQHVYPELPAGEVGMRSGAYMASADEIFITVKSTGGHAALPHNTVDTVLMASQIVVSLQQIVSRFIPTQIPSVLSFGNVVCDSVMNVIPETVELQGTFRIMDEEWRYRAHDKIKSIVNGIVDGMGGSCEIDIKIGFPSVYNNPQLTHNSLDAAREYLGDDKVHELDIRMTAEDFAFYAQKYPACFYRLGVGHTDGTKSGGLHSPSFLANEDSLKTGIQLMSYLALKAL